MRSAQAEINGCTDTWRYWGWWSFDLEEVHRVADHSMRVLLIIEGEQFEPERERSGEERNEGDEGEKEYFVECNKMGVG